MGNFKVTSVDDDTVELGVRKGNESYDSESGELHETVRVSRAELEKAIRKAHTEGQARRKATEGETFSRFDPSDVRADSSPRSEDRPPVLVSSDSNPTEANPQGGDVESPASK